MSGFAGLAVADDQLTLAAADGEHGVDGQNTGLQRLIDLLTGDDAGGLVLNGPVVIGLDLALAVDGSAQRI